MENRAHWAISDAVKMLNVVQHMEQSTKRKTDGHKSIGEYLKFFQKSSLAFFLVIQIVLICIYDAALVVGRSAFSTSRASSIGRNLTQIHPVVFLSSCPPCN